MAAAKSGRVAKRKPRATAAKRAPARRKPVRAALQRLEHDLPPDLKAFSRRVRRDLTRLEKQIETATRDARRRSVRVVREVSHELGQLEARGEREFKRLTRNARRDAVKVLKKLEKSIEPPKARRRKTPRARKTTRGPESKGSGI